MKMSFWWHLRHALGVPEHAVSWRERVAATVTSALGIALVAALAAFPPAPHGAWLIASIGASAVLVFAVPHGPLSQPWAVLGGHGLSAVVGVAVAQQFGGGPLAAALAVGLAIGVMHSLRCIHPPGGATALTAVMMSAAGHPPSWDFVLSPVLFDAALIVLAAGVLNAPFAWRRYPAVWAFHRAPAPKGASLAPEAPFTARQLRDALDGLDTMIDIGDEDLQSVYQALRRQQAQDALEAGALRVGAYYSNGLAGEAWAVRRIIDASGLAVRRPQLIVKTVAGAGRGDVRVVTVKDFLAWGRYEVVPDTAAWQRLEPGG